MDHKQEREFHKKKEREQETKEDKETEKSQDREEAKSIRFMHPVWFYILGTVLVAFIVLFWILYL